MEEVHADPIVAVGDPDSYHYSARASFSSLDNRICARRPSAFVCVAGDVIEGGEEPYRELLRCDQHRPLPADMVPADRVQKRIRPDREISKRIRVAGSASERFM
jgi:hypothetical protein